MKKTKIYSVLFAMITSISLNISCIPVQAVSKSADNVISEKLKNALEVNSDDKIPVQIQLKDTIDYSYVESQAKKLAGITDKEVLMVENSDFGSITDESPERIKIERKYEDYREARIDVICDEVEKINRPFIEKYDINAESVSRSLTDINLVYLTADEIKNIAYDKNVQFIDAVDICESFTCGYSISSADSCIRSYTSRNYGYDGTGVKVGIVEHGWANRNLIGTKLINAGGPTTGTDSHATFVAGEVNALVPGADIYLKKSADNYANYDIDAVEELMIDYKVQVINMSLEFDNNGAYSTYSRSLDKLIRQNKVTVVVAAGNSGNKVNGFGVANNVITVGAVDHHGATTATPSTYSIASFSAYQVANDVVNKPDLCAPGVGLDLYNYSNWDGTSMSTPLVTGVVAQMIDRNVGMAATPQTLKAAVMASCYYNTGSSFSSNFSNIEGAGVVDGDFTYRVARNGRRWHFNYNSDSTADQTYSIYADYNNKPFRVSIAWESEIINDENKLTDYDLYIYKGNTLVTSSTGIRNNEIIVIPAETVAQYGAGYYTAKIHRFGSVNTSSDCVGLAWEQ